MASLTDRTYQKNGQTVLYMPVEEFRQKKQHKIRIYHRGLESVYTGRVRSKKLWTTKTWCSMRVSGPGDEINFANRTIDLSGISNQLVKPEVQNIIEVLQIAKSCAVCHSRLCRNLSARYGEADNLKFLKTLEDSCNRLVTASPPDPRYFEGNAQSDTNDLVIVTFTTLKKTNRFATKSE